MRRRLTGDIICSLTHLPVLHALSLVAFLTFIDVLRNRTQSLFRIEIFNILLIITGELVAMFRWGVTGFFIAPIPAVVKCGWTAAAVGIALLFCVYFPILYPSTHLPFRLTPPFLKVTPPEKEGVATAMSIKDKKEVFDDELLNKSTNKNPLPALRHGHLTVSPHQHQPSFCA